MIDDIANRVAPADTRTRISTFVTGAGQLAGAVTVEDALGTAADVRIAKVFRQAGTDSVFATCICTTRR